MKKHLAALTLTAATVGATLAALSGTAACTSAQLHVMSGEFKTCAKADLGQLLPNGVGLLTDVAQKIEGNAVDLEADLASDALIVGADAVKCAIAAVAAVIAPATGSGSATTHMAPPGLLRAQAWAAKH